MGLESAPFSELLCEVVDNRGRTCPTAETGVPLIATNCIRNELLYPTYDKIRYVSTETYRNWFRGHPKPGDILFVNKATPGRVCLVPEPIDFCIAQDMVAVRADPSKVYPKYLFAALRSESVQAQIAQMHVGTLIPHFKKGDFDKLRIPLLGPERERFVGNLYFDLSNKIDLNRRMSETLESLARALFKSWFVDFDPVRAKATGRATDLSPEVAALFPDKFQASELGLIPMGWEVGPLEKILILQRGFDLPATQRREGNYPVLAASGPSGTHDEFLVNGPGVTTGRSGVLGKVFYVDGDFWPLNTSLWVKEFRHARPAFAFHLLSRMDLSLLNAGSAVPTLNRNHVHGLPTVVPPMTLIDRFEQVAAANRERQRAGDMEARTLAALRDALLPRLISGDLRLNVSPLPAGPTL